MHKKLLCKWHISPTHVIVTSLASGIAIFTLAFTRYAATLPCKTVVSSLFVLVHSVFICLSRSPSTYLFISYIPPAISLSFSSDGYGLEDGSSIPWTSRNFCLLYSAQADSMNKPIYPLGIGDSLMAVKGPGHEPDPSPSSSDKVTNAWSFTSTPVSDK